MAKRAPVDEKPFRPLDLSVLHDVVQHRTEAGEASPVRVEETKVIPLPETASRAPTRSDAVVASSTTPVLQRLDQEKRVLFTREETQSLDRLVAHLAMRLRTQVKASHVLRAVTGLLLAAEVPILQRAAERGELTRPANGDFGALQRFERELAQILAHAIRDAGLPRA